MGRKLPETVQAYPKYLAKVLLDGKSYHALQKFCIQFEALAAVSGELVPPMARALMELAKHPLDADFDLKVNLNIIQRTRLLTSPLFDHYTQERQLARGKRVRDPELAPADRVRLVRELLDGEPTAGEKEDLMAGLTCWDDQLSMTAKLQYFLDKPAQCTKVAQWPLPCPELALVDQLHVKQAPGGSLTTKAKCPPASRPRRPGVFAGRRVPEPPRLPGVSPGGG